MNINRSLIALGAAGAVAAPALAQAAPLPAAFDGAGKVRHPAAEKGHDRAVREYVRARRANAKLRGQEAPKGVARRVERWTTLRLQRESAQLARANRRLRRRAAASGVTTATGGATATPAHLQAIAACESGGDPRAIGGGGQFRGKYQFTYETWAGVGGSGDPAAAPEAEQDRRAAMLYAQAGSSPWPVCGG